MLTAKQTIYTSVPVCALLSTAAAQESPNASAQSSSPTITAAAAGEQVRITAPASIVQLHVEVYAASGEKLFDQEIRGGNVFDWHLQNGQGKRVAPGDYVCVVTAKSVSRQADSEDRDCERRGEIGERAAGDFTAAISFAGAGYWTS